MGSVLRGFKPLAILKSRFSDSDQISKTFFCPKLSFISAGVDEFSLSTNLFVASVESRNLKTKEQKICQSSDFIFLNFVRDRFFHFYLLLVIEKKINGEPLKIFGESSIASCLNNSPFILCKRSRI